MGKPRFCGKTTACTSNRKLDKRYMKKVARQNLTKPGSAPRWRRLREKRGEPECTERITSAAYVARYTMSAVRQIRKRQISV